MEKELRPGLLAGRYELGPLLGRGGMGEVRAGVDMRLERPVAVKLLSAELARLPGARRGFETEARIVARLVHPNIVTVYDSGDDDGLAFLVMERLPGQTLADELAAGPLSVARVRTVVVEILAALEAAHQAGVVHRDIKPSNVLLTDDGHAKVGDFGIAKTFESDQTLTRELHATPAYLAPERLSGEPASPRSDLYSVGVLLYEASGGHRPFDGESPFAVLHAIERGEVTPLTRLRPDVPVAIAAACERAMARDPHQRFGSAAEMAAALAAPDQEAVATLPIHRQPLHATVPMTLESSHRTPPPVATAPTRAPEGRASRPGRRRFAAVGLVVALGAAAGIVAVAVSGGGDAQNSPPPASATPPVSASSHGPKLPRPLDRALRQLEQDVAR